MTVREARAEVPGPDGLEAPNRKRRVRIVIAVGLLIGVAVGGIVSLLVAGDDDSASNQPAPEPVDGESAGETDDGSGDGGTPAEPRPSAPGITGDLAVYVGVTLGGDSTLFHDGSGPTLPESSEQAVVVVDPRTGDGSVLATARSAGTAATTLLPVTSGGELVAVRAGDGSVGYQKLDPLTGETVGPDAPLSGPGEIIQIAFSGDTAYSINVADGGAGDMSFVRHDLATAEATDLGDFTIPDNGSLLADGSDVYFVTIPVAEFPVIGIHRLLDGASYAPRFVENGEITGLAQHAPVSYERPVLADGAIWWLAAVDDGRVAQIQIWRYGLAEAGPIFEPWATFDVDTGLSAVPFFDVDGPYAVAVLQRAEGHELVVFDGEVGVHQIRVLGPEPYALALLDLGG